MQQSSAPLPITPSAPPERTPKPVFQPPRRSHAKRWLWLAIFAAASAGTYWLWQHNLAEEALASKRAAQNTLRTATATAGNVLATMRLTGTTGPEKYITILGPQMRGSRSFQGGQGGGMMGRRAGGGGGSSGGGGGGGGSSSGGSSAGGSVQSNSSPAVSGSMGGSVSSTSSSSSSGSDSSASMGAGASVGGVRSASTAMKATTTRTSSSTGSRSSLSSGQAATAASATMGTGMGSTADQLMGGSGSPGGGGGGGGGGMSDFGSVLQDLIKPGVRVKKGDKLAEFDRQFMLQRLEDYKSGILQQELNITRQVEDIKVRHKAHDQQVLVAKSDRDKAQLDLKTIPVRSAIDTERFKLAVEEAEAKYQQVLTEEPYVQAGDDADVKIAEMALQNSKLEFRRSEQNAERMVVRSTMEGTVVMMPVFIGGDFRQVQQGDPVTPGMTFLQVVEPSSMIVNATINQVDVERIRVGAKATIKFDAFPDLELPAHVFSVAAMPKAANGARATFLKEIPVRLKLDKMDPRVIPDLSVSADVQVQAEEASTVVPLSSIFQDSHGLPHYVWVKGATGWSRREVKLGVASNHMVVVREGLRSGEVVAEELPPQPAPGEKAASS